MRFGTSRPGIVAAISSTLADSRYNIVDMSRTVVRRKFAVLLIAEIGDGAVPLTEDLFQAMHLR